MIILAIESSCDDTSASVLENGFVKSNIISSQYFHKKYGGIIPELASRAHLKTISEVCNEALSEANIDINSLDALAVTNSPGLIGSLVVGTNFTKGLGVKYDLPVIPVNHIEGHLYSGCLQDSSLKFPFVSLVVSGGHTVIFYVKSYSEYDIIGSTVDDAAGEAFDKIAKLMGLTYPGGPLIDKYAKEGDSKKYDFPRPMFHDKNYNFSFSGLKTSVRYFIHKTFPDGVPKEEIPNICASVQAAITDVLVKKTVKATIQYKCKSIVIAGGVSANSELRKKMENTANKANIKFVAPDMGFCMDNAAMIAFLAEQKYTEHEEGFYKNYSFKANPQALRAKAINKR